MMGRMNSIQSIHDLDLKGPRDRVDLTRARRRGPPQAPVSETS